MLSLSSKKNTRLDTMIHSTQKKKRTMFRWLWTKSLLENIILLNKILIKASNSMNFMKKLKSHYHLKKKNTNVSFAKTGLSRKMRLFILITEVAKTKWKRFQNLMILLEKSEKDSNQWREDRHAKLSKKQRKCQLRLSNKKKFKWRKSNHRHKKKRKSRRERKQDHNTVSVQTFSSVMNE